MSDSTVRTAAATPLNQIRNVRNRIALLWLRQTHRHLSAEERAELNQLQAKLNRLEREYTEKKYGVAQ